MTIRLRSNLALRSGRRRRPARRRGQAVIEMALVMTVLLTLSFGMVDFGLFLTGYIRASNCAREVARAAVIRNASAATVCGGNQLTPLFETATISLSPSAYTTASAGTTLTVTVSATYRWKAIAPVINAFFPGTPWNSTISTTTTATMRMEGSKV